MTSFAGQVPDTLRRPGEWEQHAACGQADPDIFHEAKSEWQAKVVCAECPVRAECEAWVMDLERGQSAETRESIVAGMSPHERATLDPAAVTPPPRPLRLVPAAKPRKAAPVPTEPAACPSVAAYRRHVKRGEPIDPGCKAAYADARKKERTARRDAKVYALWCRGLSDVQIGAELGVGIRAVAHSRDRLAIAEHRPSVMDEAS